MSPFVWTSVARTGLALLVATSTWASSPLSAQEDDRFPGVRLGLVYDPNAYLPGVAIKPLTGRFGGDEIAAQVEAILGRDLRYSDRFDIIDSLPPSLAEDGVNYGIWDGLGAVWVVSGQVEGSGDAYVLSLELHDVVYSQRRQRGRYPLPPPDDDGFRMAVHGAADQIVEWITGEPGMAASRIAFSRRDGDGNQEIWMVDADGENLRRVTRYGSITMSPAWSPDGSRLAYMSYKSGSARIHELDLATGAEKALPADGDALYMTPAYHPDGRRIAFAVVGAGRPGLFSYDLASGCCLTQLSSAPRHEDISPTYSPDGERLAFMTNRLAGTAAPQIYVMEATGDTPELLSPFDFERRGYYTSPDWSPTSDLVAFHGRIGRGMYQILVADVSDGRNRLSQLTREGRNEDPSWAPDGRHLVFVGDRRSGTGLWTVDAVSGRIRLLVPNIRARVPEWSPSLAPRAGNILRN
jgi:TolB protein